jgi:electron transport complex protein RnfC
MFTVFGNRNVVVVESGGSFSRPARLDAPPNIEDFSKDEIIEAIRSAGIVGLGGASFPTAVKLSPPPDARVDTLVVNGSECEPYLTVDDMLMNTFPEEIITGVRITLRALGINRAIVGIEKNKPAAIAALRNAVKSLNLPENITVKALPARYPQGAEKQLIYSLTKRKVPSGALPFKIGVVVQNVGTLFAIREAVLFKKSLYERYLTVSGSLVNNPGNYKVRSGTLISDIAADCGGLKGNPAKILIGGPMCGIALPDMNVPVVKGTSGILFLSEDEVHTAKDYRHCIRCGKCVSVCPIGLLPYELGTSVEKTRFDISDGLNPLDCIMCGSCAFECPSLRPLPHFIKIAQDHIRNK